MIRNNIFSLCEQTKKQLLKDNAKNTKIYIELTLKENELKNSIKKIKQTDNFKEKYILAKQIDKQQSYISKILKDVSPSPKFKNNEITYQNILMKDFIEYHNYSIHIKRKKGD